MDLLSVIIPVYNVEYYLEECLNSIINQTYKNLQIIIVDDGSTDNSGKICDEYAERDCRITVIHQENAGAGAAKNTGLNEIKGKYFAIIDSDDYVDINMFDIMIHHMKDSKSDIVQCLFCNKYKGMQHNAYFFKTGHRILSREQFLYELLDDWKYAIFANKLFKTELLGETRFPVGRKIDDEFFTYKLVCNAKKIENIEDILYFYRMRKSSVMNNSDNDRLLMDRADCFIERYEYIKDKGLKVNKEFLYRLSDSLLWINSQVKTEERKNTLKEYMIKYPYKKQCIVNRIKKKILNKNVCINYCLPQVDNDLEYFD